MGSPRGFPPGEYKSVDGSALESHTKQGWVLCKVLHSQNAGLFLIVRDEDTVMQELREAVRLAEQNTRTLRDSVERLEDLLVEAGKRRDKLAAELGRLEEKREADLEAFERLKKVYEKLEADAGAVRRYVGERTWKEALDPEGPETEEGGVKSEHTGLSGAEYSTESVNVRPGRAPDTTWMGLSADREGYGLVALVGFKTQIMKFARRVAREGTPHPMSVLDLPDLPHDFGLAVTYVGMWPEARIRGVVTQLSGGGGWRGWAREFIALRNDPERIDAGHPSEDRTKEYVDLFFQQCRKVTES